MKLAKFFRNNSRTLLMVFMSLLLVTFLIPQAVQGLSGRDAGLNRPWGKAFGKKVTDSDLQKVYADAQLLARAGLLQRLPEGASLEYYLQIEEARRLGVRVGREEVKQWLAQGGFTDQRLREIQRTSHRGYDQIYDVIGQWVAVQRLSRLQLGALVDSLPRLEKAYRDTNQDAAAKLSIIDDNAFVKLVPEPSDEQLRTFFDECKARKAAHTEKELLFGYLLPDRVKIEYLTLDPQKIKGEIAVQAVQVQRYFAENAESYKKRDPVTTQPGPDGQFPQVLQTFEEARDRVRQDYREIRATEVAQGLLNDIYTDASKPWNPSSRDAAGFTEPPAAGPMSFEELKQKFSTTHQVEYGTTGLLSQDEVLTTAVFGKATMSVGRETIRAGDLALRVKGILAEDPNDGLPVLNLREPFLVLTTRTDPQSRKTIPNQAFVLRVVEVAPSAPPESLDAVRTQLTADWKLMQAHEMARQRAETLASSARQVGLAKAVEDATELKDILQAADQAASQPAETGVPPLPTQYVQDLQPFTPNKITRLAPFLQKLGRVQEVPQEIFALAETPVDTATPYRAKSIPQANLFRWVVAELLEIKPLYAGSFEAQITKSLRENWNKQQGFYTAWNDPEYLKQRTGFVPDPATTEKSPPPSR
jgi:hypothetical protein